jgi:hypothetical protein
LKAAAEGPRVGTRTNYQAAGVSKQLGSEGFAVGAREWLHGRRGVEEVDARGGAALPWGKGSR